MVWLCKRWNRGEFKGGRDEGGKPPSTHARAVVTARVSTRSAPEPRRIHLCTEHTLYSCVCVCICVCARARDMRLRQKERDMYFARWEPAQGGIASSHSLTSRFGKEMENIPIGPLWYSEATMPAIGRRSTKPLNDPPSQWVPRPLYFNLDRVSGIPFHVHTYILYV